MKNISEKMNPNKRNWMISQRDQRNVYSLSIIGTLNVGISEATFDFTTSEYIFNVNPKSIQVDEPAAATIRPTQGGVHVEHQGNIFKDIVISGTTGLRPNRGPGGFIPVDLRTGLPAGEKSGFEELIDLNNLFREYARLKKTAQGHAYTMVWKNGREGDYFVVEPINFKTNRDSSSPLTTSYEIRLKTISRLDASLVSMAVDPHMLRNSFANRRSKINRIINSLADGITRLTAIQDNLTSRGLRFATDIIKPLNDLVQALTGMVSSSQRIFDIPRNSIGILRSNVMDLLREVTSFPSSYTSLGIGRAEDAQAASACRNIRRALDSILSLDFLFGTTVNSKVERKRQAYISSRTTYPSGGEPLDLANEPGAASVAEAVIGANDDIRKLAKKLLGTKSRWKMLALMNNLQAPYISALGDGVTVLRPGDTILYPSTEGTPRTAVGTNSSSSSLSPFEEILGRDVKLVETNSGITQFDLAIENGDVARIAGLENMQQAVRLKFEIEQGELPVHPFFGIKYPLGVKVKGINNLTEFDVNARATLLADPRINDINDLDISFEGNLLYIKGSVNISGVNRSLAMDFATRR